MNNKISILLVEDDEVDIMSVKRAFDKNKITNTLYIAHNGIEALEILKGTDIIPFPCIILLDINLPRMNGIEFLQLLRADENLKTITVIVLTTSDEERDIMNAYKFNVAGYIVKPLTMQSFTKAISVLDLY